VQLPPYPEGRCDERLVEVALEHLRHNHPAAPLREERVRRIVFTCAYDIEYATV